MPRAKRSKQYKRLMSQYEMNFGFREPYQVLCDSQFLEAAIHSKMDISHVLKATLHGSTKLLITQCSMRWLYARKNEPGIGAVIEFAKEMVERRRCGHHPSDYPEPLKEIECLHSVVDPSSKGVNKHRYVCALNDDEIRSSLRNVQVVPLLYIRRSVLIMEPASSNTIKARSRDEKAKFTAELKSPGVKRKREQEGTDVEDNGQAKEEAEQMKPEKKKKKTHGHKEPNPLSVKKKKEDKSRGKAEPPPKAAQAAEMEAVKPDNEAQLATTGEASKGKRRRKHKSKAAAAQGDDGDNTQMETPAGDE
ncbi:Fcf1-domain-containing protein [Xylariaceae sp. AK1471]|nr:Fcf1-domain-containing protein [Xylariaceae sp. AK1471]